MQNTAHYVVPSMLDPQPFASIQVLHNSSDTKFRKKDKLERAKVFDPKFEEEREKIDQQVQTQFPAFDLASLEAVIEIAPSWKKLPAVPKDGG